MGGRAWAGVLLLAACGDPSGTDEAMDTGTVATSPGPDDGGPGTGSPTSSPSTAAESTVSPGETSTAGGETSVDGGSGTTDGGESDDGVAPPCPYEPVEGEPEFLFEVVGWGFPSLPVQVVGDPTAPDRLFVPTQFGQIYVLEPGQMEPGEPILDIGSDVQIFNEGALCSLVFHPDYPSDPRIYVYYAAQPDGRSRIEEFVIDPDTLQPIDPDSGTTILELHNGTGSHYGGMMHFDADDWLMVGIGDAADSVSPNDPMALHSKFIRIGVDPDGTPDDPVACAGCPQFGPFDYTIPPDNPFVGDPSVAPEVWAMGFRNPWRWYFDRDTGDIFAGDVGLENWEEMSLVRPGNHYGWSSLEGNHCAEQVDCDLSAGPNAMNGDGFIAPLVDYGHDPSCAVIGGPMYKSCEVPAWQGIVFYGDLCSSGISALRWQNDQLTDLGLVFPQNIGPRGSGTNAWGDVFFTGGLFSGEIYRLRPAR